MAAGDVYRKTQGGVAEITHRRLKLNARVRTMLILIDGVQPEFLLREEGAKVGAPPDFLDQLLKLELVETAGKAAVPQAGTLAAPPGAAGHDEYSRFRVAKDFMNITIVDALGIRSFFFTLKLERAGTLADLRELAPAYREALAKSGDETQADVLAARLAEMLR
jgi:hypothetical protein